MTDNAADGRTITEIQMGAAAAPEPTVVVAATLADAAGLARCRAGPAVRGADRAAGVTADATGLACCRDAVASLSRSLRVKLAD